YNLIYTNTSQKYNVTLTGITTLPLNPRDIGFDDFEFNEQSPNYNFPAVADAVVQRYPDWHKVHGTSVGNARTMPAIWTPSRLTVGDGILPSRTLPIKLKPGDSLNVESILVGLQDSLPQDHPGIADAPPEFVATMQWDGLVTPITELEVLQPTWSG